MKNSIQEVLDQFDFDKVHAYMELTKWRYFDSPNTPTIETLKRVAKDLLTQVKIGRIPWTMTGGFKASILDGGREEPSELHLDFIAVQSSTFL